MKHTRTGPSIARALSVLIGALLLLVAIGCSGGNESPAAPAGADLVVTSAVVSVNGQSVAGQTLPQGHGAGGSTRFEARLMSGNAPALGQLMWLEFNRPGRMGHHTGRIQLYDDGTHGDRVAGDGLYCFEDVVGDYGCHSDEAEPGEYHYDFYGMHGDGHESNHMRVTVTITGS